MQSFLISLCKLAGTNSILFYSYDCSVLFCFFPRTPLMLAVAYGHIDAVSLLLEKEASVDAADLLGCTALHRGVT